MQRDLVFAILKRNEEALRSLGLAHLSLFGSTARGEANAHSDVDVAVQFTPDARVDLFDFAVIAERLGSILDRPSISSPSRIAASGCSR